MQSTKSIEVTAMLSDSVIDVRHLTDPGAGKVSNATWVLLAGAAGMLLLATVSFAHGLSVSTANAEARHLFTMVDGNPLSDFRAARISPLWDVAMLLGLFGGVAGLGWGLSRYFREKKAPAYRIGQAKGVEFPTAVLAQESHAMVQPQNGEFVFARTPEMTGEMTSAQGQTALADLPLSAPIPDGARIRVAIGGNTFLIASVPAPVRQETRWVTALEDDFVRYIGGTFVGAAVGIFLLLSSIPEANALTSDSLGLGGRPIAVTIKPSDDPKQAKPLSSPSDNKAGDAAPGTGQRTAGKEGKMGKPDAKQEGGRFVMKNNGQEKGFAKKRAIENAQNAGFLGALRSENGGAFAQVFGTMEVSSGLDDREDLYGGLNMGEPGEDVGVFGTSVRGTGPGGNGTGINTIGVGAYPGIGIGSGPYDGVGVGSNPFGTRRRRAGPPEVKLGPVSGSSDIDKAMIRRYITKRLPAIRYCYERQLLIDKTLAGTVTSVFVISGTNGKVIASQASGLGNTVVEKCVAKQIRSIQFPKIAGLSVARITYPFRFQTGGQ